MKKMLYLLGLLSFTYSLFAYATTTHNAPTVSAAEKARIEAVVHQYLTTKPEVILEAMQVLQNKQMEQAKLAVQKTRQDAPQFFNALFHANNTPVAGNPNGSVTLVEFFDYQCPHCIDVVPTINALVKANPNLRVVYREWPIRGPLSDFASRAALAAQDQNKYLPFHQALLAANKPLSQDSILEIAKTAGLNVEQLQKDMNAAKTNDTLKATVELAQNLKLFGTPAFFLAKTDNNGKEVLYFPGELPQAQLQEAIDKMKQ